jgi:hypothetical protein
MVYPFILGRREVAGASVAYDLVGDSDGARDGGKRVAAVLD